MKNVEKTQLQESCLAFAKHLLAAGAVWKDSTSYSRNTKEKIPTSFSTNIGEGRIHRDANTGRPFNVGSSTLA